MTFTRVRDRWMNVCGLGGRALTASYIIGEGAMAIGYCGRDMQVH